MHLRNTLYTSTGPHLDGAPFVLQGATLLTIPQPQVSNHWISIPCTYNIDHHLGTLGRYEHAFG
jgi:hypothetical protein